MANKTALLSLSQTTDFGSNPVIMAKKITLPQHSTKHWQIRALKCLISRNCCLSTLFSPRPQQLSGDASRYKHAFF